MSISVEASSPRGKSTRRLAIGAELLDDGVHFRVWAPECGRIECVLEAGPGAGNSIALKGDADGYFAGLAAAAAAGTRYWFRLDGEGPFPDPASRSQPDGPHGPSQVIDPCSFRWSDRGWHGCGLEGQVIYEMHVGTFTPEGTWEAAARQLPGLRDLGITVLEVMPVAEFPGRFGWGYDGVDLFAPTRLYGMPDDFRRFVDRAHAIGLGVILDVVYNHFGPDGNYLLKFSKDYVTDRYDNEWGDAINFDGPNAEPVREFFITNAAYWIDEFHLDGLRLDATQQIFDTSPAHVLAEITQAVRQAAAGRKTLIVAENERQDVKLIRPLAQGGYGMDGLWNDDLHHAAMVALTGHGEAYYSDYRGTPQELISAVKYGYLYQGQRSQWQKNPRGTPALDVSPAAFVTFIQNHDQVANSANGTRCSKLANSDRVRAITALLLLAPGTPMLFQGQEFAASSPFLYFADHKPDLAKLVHEGRRKFLSQFPALALPEMQALIADPADPETFLRCKLDFSERDQHADVYAMHRDLLHLRRTDPVFRAQRPRSVDGAVLGPDAFVLRFFGGADGDRLLVVNAGGDLLFNPAPEPLLAPPEEKEWEVIWSSNIPRYGGCGMPGVVTDGNWRIAGESAVVLRA